MSTFQENFSNDVSKLYPYISMPFYIPWFFVILSIVNIDCRIKEKGDIFF